LKYMLSAMIERSGIARILRMASRLVYQFLRFASLTIKRHSLEVSVRKADQVQFISISSLNYLKSMKFRLTASPSNV
jgi:hypothetical protein